MRIYKRSYLARELNAALGSGQFHDITYDDVWRRIEDGTIFKFLERRLDFRVMLSTPQPIDRLELLLDWDSLRGCVEPFRFDGHRNGLCLLIGYLLEGISRRSQDRNYRLTMEICSKGIPGDEPTRWRTE